MQILRQAYPAATNLRLREATWGRGGRLEVGKAWSAPTASSAHQSKRHLLYAHAQTKPKLSLGQHLPRRVRMFNQAHTASRKSRRRVPVATNETLLAFGNAIENVCS